jgi:pimeloyl-ACP methyl ester carboxylesterase
MRIAPHATRAARMAATVLPLALLAAACTAAPPASGPGAPSAQSGAPSARSAAPPARPALTGAHPCRDLPRFTCSYLTVPLDRSGKVPGTLRLQVAAAANTHAPRGTLLFLTGGPGQPGVRFVAPVAHELATAMGAYRLVMIDQRGTGGQALDCPDLQRQMGESDTLPPTAQAVRSCAQTLGVRRNFFTTADTVADLDSLRQALHVRSWTLDGASYGAFTAERYALAHPGRVRRLVLDSVVPQRDAEPLYLASMHRAAFVLRQACLRQHCGYDPAAELARVIARYGDAVRIFDIMVILSIIDPRLSSPSIGFLARLHQAANGNPGPLRDLINGFYSGPPVRPEVYSSGLHAATLCADIPDMPWGNAAAPLAGRKAALARAIQRIPAAASWPFPPATAGAEGVVQECQYWPPARPDPAPPDRNLMMPALLLAGDLDLSTPLPWARQEAALLPHAQLVVIKGAGHSTQLHSAQAAAVAERFLLSPGGRTVPPP